MWDSYSFLLIEGGNAVDSGRFSGRRFKMEVGRSTIVSAEFILLVDDHQKTRGP